nr:hypothetical protein [Zobellia amurskyensis]
MPGKTVLAFPVERTYTEGYYGDTCQKNIDHYRAEYARNIERMNGP